MRRHVVKAIEPLLAASRSETSRVPFVCTNCRRFALQRKTQRISNSGRHFSTAIRNHQQTSTTAASSPGAQRPQIPQSHYDFFPETFPDGAPPKSSFTPDLKRLRREYLQLQAKSHPDLAPGGQKRNAEAMSMRINEAYKALQDPLRRAQYLLSMRGIDVEDESAKLSENELLIEVMEAREAVEEVESEEDLVAIRQENNQRIQDSVEILEDAFKADDMQQASQEAIRLRYWMNIEESIHGWEKGKGGGVNRH